MTEKLKQTIEEELAKLPKENREAINTLRWTKIVEEIGRKFLLEENKITNLQTETLLVLIGLESPSLYAGNIEINVDVDRKKSDQIAEEIFQKVFSPISDILVEEIKKSGKTNDANHEQNLNFVLSGGDYSAFIKKEPASLDTPKTSTPAPNASTTANSNESAKPVQPEKTPSLGYRVDPYRMKPE